MSIPIQESFALFGSSISDIGVTVKRKKISTRAHMSLRKEVNDTRARIGIFLSQIFYE